jgi:DNA-binding transcriptional LysR family regulator
MKSPLDTRQLLSFSTLARTRSFTATAKEMHLTQSAISHTIRALEEELGCRLLQRLGRRLILTEEGEYLQRESTRLLQNLDQLREKLETGGRWKQTRLRLGTSASLCHRLLPEVLRELRLTFPDCSVSVFPGNTPECLERLRQGDINIALCLKPDKKDADFSFLPVFSDELALFLPAFHPWLGMKRIKPEYFKNEHLLLYSRNSHTHSLIATKLANEGWVMGGLLEVGSFEAIKEMLKTGQGISFLAPWVAEQEVREGSLILQRIGGSAIKRNWGICSLKGRSYGLVEETFIGLCLDAKERLLGHNRVEFN